MYRHILIPTDGSERSERAIRSGIALAGELNARVTGAYVGRQNYLPGEGDSSTPKADEALSLVARLAADAGVACECVSVLSDTPEGGIAKIAQTKQCDLIVMATRGRSRVEKFVLGSTAAAVIADSDIPVLLCK